MSESTMTVNRLGSKNWKNSSGQFHRTGDPAIEWSNGAKEWWVNGKLHRIGGPAIERANGDKEWWVNNEFLGRNEEGFWKLWERLTDEQKKNSILLTYLPGDFSV